MPFAPSSRKLLLSLHILFSVGWLGSVAAFLVMAIVGFTSRDGQTVQSMYIAMDVISRALIVPACFGSLLTGIIQAVGAEWGLFRFYWVVVKLGITVVSTILLLVHLQPIDFMADAAKTPIAAIDLNQVRVQLIVDSAAAIVALLIATILSVYKPWGLIRDSGKRSKEERYRMWRRVGLIALLLLLAIVITKHLVNGGGHHGH